MTIILRVYRSGKLVATANELGHIDVLVSGLGKPYVAFPYVSPACRPVGGNANQEPRSWGHVRGEDEQQQGDDLVDE